jgi:hypothetical protein
MIKQSLCLLLPITPGAQVTGDAAQKTANIKIQKTGAVGIGYAEYPARF